LFYKSAYFQAYLADFHPQYELCLIPVESVENNEKEKNDNNREGPIREPKKVEEKMVVSSAFC